MLHVLAHLLKVERGDHLTRNRRRRDALEQTQQRDERRLLEARDLLLVVLVVRVGAAVVVVENVHGTLAELGADERKLVGVARALAEFRERLEALHGDLDRGRVDLVVECLEEGGGLGDEIVGLDVVGLRAEVVLQAVVVPLAQELQEAKHLADEARLLELLVVVEQDLEHLGVEAAGTRCTAAATAAATSGARAAETVRGAGTAREVHGTASRRDCERPGRDAAAAATTTTSRGCASIVAG